MLSVITPCSRIYNLPIILNSLNNLNTWVEWIIVYDKNFINEPDSKILMYSTYKIKIKLFVKENNTSNGNAHILRNYGMEQATGDYLYFLDDDNLVLPNLYSGVKDYLFKYNLLIFNQIRKNKVVSIKSIDEINNVDTGQFIVRNNIKSKWGPSYNDYREERVFLNELIKEIPKEKIIFLPLTLSYYNKLNLF